MFRLVARWTCWGLLLGALGTTAGCDTPPSDPPDLEGTTANEASPLGEPDIGPSDPSDPDGDEGNGDQDGPDPTDCGERTVDSFPGPGYIEMESSFQLDATPADSPLAKVMFGGIGCQQPFDTADSAILYEIDQRGEVLSTIVLTAYGDQKFYTRAPAPNARFVVEDGCLTLEYDRPDEGPLPDFDPAEIPEGPCGLGQFAIGREGLPGAYPQGDYICAQANIDSACQDCWEGNGAWHGEYTVSGSYVALESIVGVSVTAWALACDQPDQRVNIAEGDRVEFTWTIEIAYRSSLSPEELGYQPLQIPATP